MEADEMSDREVDLSRALNAANRAAREANAKVKALTAERDEWKVAADTIKAYLDESDEREKALVSRLQEALERDRRGDQIIVELTLERDRLAVSHLSVENLLITRERGLDELGEHCDRLNNRIALLDDEKTTALGRLSSAENIVRRLLDWPSVPVDFSALYVTSGGSEMLAAINELQEIKQAARATVVERQEILK
jgi:hypothetical protein